MLMIKKILLLLCFSILVISCKKDCYTAPEKVVFEFVNASGENLMENGTITSVGITEDTGVGVEVTKTDNYKVILQRVGSFNGTKNYRIASVVQFVDFSIRSSNVTTDCDGYQIDEINFQNADATKEAGYYRIVLN